MLSSLNLMPLRAATAGAHQYANDGEDFSSREIIRSKFLDTHCIVTIALGRIVIGPDPVERFQLLMESLKELASEKGKGSSGKPFILAWVINLGCQQAERKKAFAELKVLQSCLQNLEKGTADWLSDHAIFLMAHAEKDWIEQSRMANIVPIHKYKPSKQGVADVFFRSIEHSGNKNWRTADVITAFPGQRSAAKFFRHDAPKEKNWPDGPIAHELHSKATRRNSIIRRICRLRRSTNGGGVDREVISKLFKDGFAIFRLEDIVKITI